MEVYLIKQFDNSFKVANNSDYDKLKKLKVGETYKADIKRPRNIKFHKKFFALINMVFDNQEVYSNIDDMRKELTKTSGFYRTYLNHKGVKCYEAQSISFANMDEDTFNDLFNRFLDTVVRINGFDRELILENLEIYN